MPLVTQQSSLVEKETQPSPVEKLNQLMEEDIYIAPVEIKDQVPSNLVEAKIQSDPFPKNFAKSKVIYNDLRPLAERTKR